MNSDNSTNTPKKSVIKLKAVWTKPMDEYIQSWARALREQERKAKIEQL